MKEPSTTENTKIRKNGPSSWTVTLDKKDLLRKGYDLDELVDVQVTPAKKK